MRNFELKTRNFVFNMMIFAVLEELLEDEGLVLFSYLND